MPIPIRNIYYLLCYAWDEFAPKQLTGVETEEFPDALHLFSHVLVVGVRLLHRRGLETGYVGTQEATSIVRGRILIHGTIQLCVQNPTRLFCAFDEMSSDVLSNQILKATLRTVVAEQGLDSSLRAEVRRTLKTLARVQDIDLSARVFHVVHLHQNNRLYSFLINVCRFMFESLEAQDKPGQYRFKDVERDDARMRRIFEKFVRNFFRRRQSEFTVSKERMRWDALAADNSDLGLLPQMETDATLRSAHRTVVIECKYTESLYQNRFFAEKLRAPHLYQLSTYLRNLECRSRPDSMADGVLLYPTTGEQVDQSYFLHGHWVRVKTINLAQPWRAIEKDLLAAVTKLMPANNESFAVGRSMFPE